MCWIYEKTRFDTIVEFMKSYLFRNFRLFNTRELDKHFVNISVQRDSKISLILK